MAFASSFTSALDPFWKGLGMEEEEEEEVENRTLHEGEDRTSDEGAGEQNKRVSFSDPVFDEYETEKNRHGWTWRRKGRKDTSRRTIQRKRVEERPLSKVDFDSFDSFEEDATEHRDDHLDDDLWDEDESRDGESDTQEYQGIWQYFLFGDDTRDFDDGSTEEYDELSIYSQETNLTQTSTISEGIQNKKSIPEPIKGNSEANEGVEVEMTASTEVRSAAGVAATSPNEQKDESSRSFQSSIPLERERQSNLSTSSRTCLSRKTTSDEPSIPSEKERQGDLSSSSRTCLSRKTTSTTSAASDNTSKDESGEQKAQDPTTEQRMSSDDSTPTEAARSMSSSSTSKRLEETKKKKHRWRMVRGGVKVRSLRRATGTVNKELPTHRELDPIPEERGVVAKLPRTIKYTTGKKDGEMDPKYNVDNEQSGVGRKSCMPPSSDSVHSDLTSQATTQAASQASSEATSIASTNVPLVRLVSDNKGAQGAVVGKAKDQSAIQQQMELEESHFATVDGPQSIYTYEYESGSAMDVRYRYLSDNPEETLSVREDCDEELPFKTGINNFIE